MNRARHGLDGLQNLVPLCKDCNRVMPTFGVEEDAEAAWWIFEGGVMGEFYRLNVADGLSWAECAAANLHIMQQRGGIGTATDDDLEFYHRFLARLLPRAA